MTIKKLRTMTGMSQNDFSKYTGIPVRTIQSWEQGWRQPPDYVLNLIERIIIAENVRSGVVKKDVAT